MLVTLKSKAGETIVREPVDARELVATGEWEVVVVDPAAEGPVPTDADDKKSASDAVKKVKGGKTK